MGAATANPWFEEALCSMSLFPSSSLCLGCFPPSKAAQVAVGQGGSFVGRPDTCRRLSPLAAEVGVTRLRGKDTQVSETQSTGCPANPKLLSA